VRKIITMARNIAESVIFLQLLSKDVIELSRPMVGNSLEVLNFISFRILKNPIGLQCEKSYNVRKTLTLYILQKFGCKN